MAAYPRLNSRHHLNPCKPQRTFMARISGMPPLGGGRHTHVRPPLRGGIARQSKGSGGQNRRRSNAQRLPLGSPVARNSSGTAPPPLFQIAALHSAKICAGVNAHPDFASRPQIA
jgi:hypothetical protein